VISFSGAMMPGPVTAVVIANARHSRFAGFVVAAGHAMIEIPLILFLAFYAANFMENPLVHALIAFAGAAMLLYVGGDMIRKSGREEDLQIKNYSAFLGGIVSSINPYFIVWWATTGLAMILQAKSFGHGLLVFFIIVHLSVDFFWDGILGWLMNRSGAYNYPKVRKIVTILLGVCLILVALYFVFSGIRVLGSR
jgi:threonine/homoserine/homoserine lactone efflux protein